MPAAGETTAAGRFARGQQRVIDAACCLLVAAMAMTFPLNPVSLIVSGGDVAAIARTTPLIVPAAGAEVGGEEKGEGSGTDYKGGSAAAPATTRTIYVILLNPECNDDNDDNGDDDVSGKESDLRGRFDYYMHLNNTENERFFGYYEVVCMPSVTRLSDVEGRVLSALRSAMPANPFVFVYPDSMKEQYYDYMAGKYGDQYRSAASGNTDIAKGMAFANEMPVTVKHEMGHLALCGTWHDAEGKDTGVITKHPAASGLPWCE